MKPITTTFTFRRQPALIGIALLFVLILFEAAPRVQAQDAVHCPPGQSPQFQLGFALLKDELGEAMGEPVDCLHYDEQGNAHQTTTTGMAFYHKQSNTLMFSTETRSWIRTADGLVEMQGNGGQQPAVVMPLQLALREQMQVTRILGNPEIGEQATAIRNAFQQATPHAQNVQTLTQSVVGQLDGPSQMMAQMALKELNDAMAIGQLIQSEGDGMASLRHEELKAHGSAALTAINLALHHLGAGPSAPGAARPIQPAELQLPQGYQVEVVADRLTFPSVVEVDQDGTVYVGEAGFSYGDVKTVARVLRIAPDGASEVVAEGFNGPLAGIAVHNGILFVSHRGTISSVDLASGAQQDLITGLPSRGDHYNENIVIGPDEKIYFTQGTVTNSAVVGLDNYMMGWLPQAPEFHDTPCRDLTLAGQNYTTGNPLTEDPTDTVSTGAYQPFGTPSRPGQVVQGQTKCSGAILRANLDGSGLEVVADGFRNPYGLAFHPDGRLFATENGPDTRGSRPVSGPDNVYEVVQGGWYGWPDFYGGLPVNHAERKPHNQPVSQPVLLDPPPLARQPLARLEHHAASTGFDFSRSEGFGFAGQMFVAEIGDISPMTTGGEEEHAGHRVSRVSPQGTVQQFLAATGEHHEGNPAFRPTDATFSPDGNTLYVTHFGRLEAVAGGILPTPATGALLRVTRTGETAAGASIPVTGAPEAPPEAGPQTARAELIGIHGTRMGHAVLAEQGDGTVQIRVEVSGFDPIAGDHGIHIYEVGRCDPPDFSSAGEHFNPTGAQHGLQNPNGPHAGDLPNIQFYGDGSAVYQVVTDRISLRPGQRSILDADGAALIIHASPDDQMHDPSGHSGEAVACGVIVPEQ